MRVLITGITGFIGTHLAQRLLEIKSYELVGTFRNKEKALMYEKQGIEMRKTDLLQPNSLKNITKNIDVIIHLAGLMRFHDPWDVLYNLNVRATQSIAVDALQYGIQHFIYCSSTEATGSVPNIPGDETSPYNPSYMYGKTKQIAEQWLKEKQQTAGLPLTILRPTGVYGPGDLYVTLSTVRAIANKKLRILPGKGDSVIQFTYVEDVIQGFQRSLENPTQSRNETFILASNDYTTYKEMFTIIANLLDVPPPTHSIPMNLAKTYLYFLQWNNKRKGVNDFVMHTSLIDTMKTNRAYSNAKAKKILGFNPHYNFKDGMKKTIEWYKGKNLI